MFISFFNGIFRMSRAWQWAWQHDTEINDFFFIATRIFQNNENIPRLLPFPVFAHENECSLINFFVRSSMGDAFLLEQLIAQQYIFMIFVCLKCYRNHIDISKKMATETIKHSITPTDGGWFTTNCRLVTPTLVINRRWCRGSVVGSGWRNINQQVDYQRSSGLSYNHLW